MRSTKNKNKDEIILLEKAEFFLYSFPVISFFDRL